jgi:hypothetical protein
MLLAYDASGAVVATLDYLVRYDNDGNPVGIVDFAAHEDADGENTDVWRVENAVGSKVWPEWIGGRAHDFRVELDGPPGRKRIAALVHRTSGHRRERDAVEQAIREAPIDERTGARDLRRIVGGPDRPFILDAEGRTKERVPRERPRLPLMGVR